MPKARRAAEAASLEQIPNIARALAADLRLIGIEHPRQLKRRSALNLYRELCIARGTRQDPCVLDTFIAAVDFMNGGAPAPWWTFTAARKRQHPRL